MKTLKRILLFGIVAGVTFFTACEDDETETLNKEESQEVIETNSKQMETAFSEMKESKGMKAIEVLGGLLQEDDPFSNQKNLDVSKDFITNISEILNPEKLYTEKAGNTQFIFGDYTGTYTWQPNNPWDIDSNNPDDAIIIEFPADTANYSEEGNNAVLTVSNYEEQKITTDTGDIWMPVTLSAKLKISGTEYVNVDYSLTLDSDGNPAKVSMLLDLKPYSYKLEFESNNMMFSLFKDGENRAILSTDLQFTFLTSEMNKVKEINGSFQMGNTNFDGWVKPHALTDSSQYENVQSMGDFADQMNENMSIKVYKFDSGEKMANLVFEDFDTTPAYPIMGDIALVFEYNDGTTQEAGPYFESIITQIESMFNQLQEEEL